MYVYMYRCTFVRFTNLFTYDKSIKIVWTKIFETKFFIHFTGFCSTRKGKDGVQSNVRKLSRPLSISKNGLC